jgi:hypothetical protein
VLCKPDSFQASALRSHLLLQAQSTAGPDITVTNWAEVVLGPTVVWQPPEVEVAKPKAPTNILDSATEHFQTSELKKEIRLTANGSIADFGLLTVEFASDIASDRPVVVTAPDGRTLAFRPAFLVFSDGSQSVLIGEVTNSIGEIVFPSEVIYRHAFSGILAHIRYEYNALANTLTQDILLEEQPPELPKELDPRTARLEVWSAWFDSEPVAIRERTFDLLDGETRLNFGRLEADGTLDRTFDASVDFPISALQVQPDGRIIMGGQFTAVAGQPRNHIARLYPDGTLDAAFDPDANQYVSSLALQADGKILIGGYFWKISGLGLEAFARLDQSGWLDYDYTYNADAYGVTRVLALTTGGRLLVGGDILRLCGQPPERLGRVTNPEPAVDELTVEGNSVTWLRGGAAPEVWRTVFDVSIDGTNWTRLGPGVRIDGGWQREDLIAAPGAFIRARGFVSGAENSSGWFVEKTLRVPGPPPLRILVDEPSFGMQSGSFGFTVSGLAGGTVVVETSPDMAGWTPVATNANFSGSYLFTDSQRANSRKFYRARVEN